MTREMRGNALRFVLMRMHDELVMDVRQRGGHKRVFKDWELFETLFPDLSKKKEETAASDATRYGTETSHLLLKHVADAVQVYEKADYLVCTARLIAMLSKPSAHNQADARFAWRTLTRPMRGEAYSQKVSQCLGYLMILGAEKSDLFDQLPARYRKVSSRRRMKSLLIDDIMALDFEFADVPTIAKEAKELWNNLTHVANCAAREEEEKRVEYEREAANNLQALYCLCADSPAKGQLLSYINEAVEDCESALGSMIEKRLESGAFDNMRDGREPEPLDMVFGKAFRNDFDAKLREPGCFLWARETEHQCFWNEMERLGSWRDRCEDKESYRWVVVTAYSMCLMAALVGPGSFLPELVAMAERKGPRSLLTQAQSEVQRPADEATTEDRRHSDSAPRRHASQGRIVRLVPVSVSGATAQKYDTRHDERIHVYPVPKAGTPFKIRIGRSAAWTSGPFGLRIGDPCVSREHATISLEKVEGGASWHREWVLTNQSANGTVVRRRVGSTTLLAPPAPEGKRQTQPNTTILNEGDIITLSEVFDPMSREEQDGYRFELD